MARPARIPSQWCWCDHLLEDHDDSHRCNIIEHLVRCPCKRFAPYDNDDQDDDICIIKNMPFAINDSKIAGKDYSEFIISCIKKTVKQEDALVRQIVYTMLSAYSNNPINLGIIAPTSEGKNYTVIQAAEFGPKEDRQPIYMIVEADKDCRCMNFTSDEENDGWGYWFTDDEGRKLEGRA